MAPATLTWHRDPAGHGGAFQAFELLCVLFALDSRDAASTKLRGYNLQPPLQAAAFSNTRGHPTPVIRHREELDRLLQHVKDKGQKLVAMHID